MTASVKSTQARLGGSQALTRRILDDLAAATADPPGVTREAYGPREQYAHDLVRREAEALGAASRVDAAGNLYLTYPGQDRRLPALIIGSHLDSVPHGGNFDGAAGVVAGLGVMCDLAEAGLRPPRDLVVMAIRAEEAAWFPLSYPGSEAALGRMPRESLDAKRSDTGLTLAEHMRTGGFDPEPVREGVAQIAADAIAAFVEVHIEQGPRLEAAGAPVGLVTGIAGGFRYVDARCFGRYAHSGAEPRAGRRDSVLGFVDFVHGLDAAWSDIEAEGLEATITVGRVESDPTQHGGSRVLGDLGFTLDVRSTDPAVLRRLGVSIDRIAAEVSTKRGVLFAFGRPFTWAAAPMDPALIAGLSAAAALNGLQAPHLPSGAGHDAAAFAAAGVPSAMLFVRNQNGSHNPDEAMAIGDLDRAVRLLVSFVVNFKDTTNDVP